jgi:hypothetical protein
MATIYSISKGQTAQADPRKMTAKRTLTPREQEKVREEVRAEEILRNPGSRVTVQVDDDTDDYGYAVVRVIRVSSRAVPRDLKP